jgi:ABC-2 type transport system permease protein
MQKILLVAWREFRQRIRERGFLFTAIGTPLLIMVIWTVTGVFNLSDPEQPLQELEQRERPTRVVGYVDQAGFIQSVPAPVPEELFRALPDIAAAEAALERNEISAFYVVPPDYQETGQVRRVSPDLPTNPPDTNWFEWVLLGNLFPDAGPDEVARLRWPFDNSGPEFVSLTAEGEEGAEGNMMLPFLVALIVITPLFTSGGYLFQSLAQEKSNRVMEILLVSLRPRQLLAGKLLGLSALTLVQYVAWVGITGIVLNFTGREPIQFLSGANLTVQELFFVFVYALGGFVLYAAIMAGIGALSPDVESSRAWVFFVNLPMMIPIFLWASIASAPNGPLAVALSMIPFSAPMAMLMRLTTTVVPSWQILVSIVLLLLTCIGTILLMARLFRVQTLLSGESISVERAWSALVQG